MESEHGSAEYGSIERELHVDASPEVVFEVLSKPEYIRDWWSAENDVEPTAGATGRLTWTDEGGGESKSEPFTVVEADPPRTFSFRWTYDESRTGGAGTPAGPGNSLLVTFELVPSGEGTTVRFRETGYRERGWEAALLEAYYNDHRQGWDFYLARLAACADRLAATR
ncbi:SRPBCC domain-containing protein [Streptomyces mangrovisoli]|uniref:Polyketide cyclase n=1 Tax=Streptomyces mangrovisoli TaxID=1428628 RepID=A0A1J4P263_9ACTN|nr:SRPBCC domain-containing protein [Streptomyces mangrovisoli]OIJ68855.1 polyketide cyclase [Streptomyces mangrovisoli]